MFFLHKDFIHPKYWLLCLIILAFWFITRMPYKVQITVGDRLGNLLYQRSTKVRKTIKTNVDACFAEMPETDRQKLAQQSGVELGKAIMETFLVWFRGLQRFFRDRVSVEGAEYYYDAVSQGRGVILLSCHYGSVDLNAALLSSLDRNNKKFICTYRQTNEIVNRFLRSYRGKFCDKLVGSSDQRTIVNELKKGSVVWYAPDIEVSGKGSVFASFMGVQAYTTTAISRLAKITNAIVVPVAHYRSQANHNLSYSLKVFPALKNFPSQDIQKDTRVINQTIENIISPNPASYWWAIKRFKIQPNGVSLYVRRKPLPE